MTDPVYSTGVLTLLWPLLLCAAAWGLMVWALHQRDSVSEAVNGLLAPRTSAETDQPADVLTRSEPDPVTESGQRRIASSGIDCPPES